MRPVVTPAAMAEVDERAPEPIDELIDRAARAVALIAVRLLGGVYGRRVVVLAGPGNNGADGRVAAHHLERRGVLCRIVDVADSPSHLPSADLIIDAAFGTGLRRPYEAPTVPPGVPVLAVDIPSGVDGLTGEVAGRAMPAVATVTFAAHKPGLLLEPGRGLAGEVIVADIGLSVPEGTTHLMTDLDAAQLLASPPADHHKWRAGVRIVGGSPGMTGAVWLAARAAQRSGAGIVEIAAPGGDGAAGPTEAVGVRLPSTGWGAAAVDGLRSGVRAVLAGPGLGVAPLDDRRQLLGIEAPLVLDADMLQVDTLPLLADRPGPTVLTPHDGEWHRMGGSSDPDRVAATRDFAVTHGVVVVRKGPTTVVADRDGEARIIDSGTPALASAGTGDVLAGMIVALLARGLTPIDAASLASHLHGRAGARCGVGLVAGDLADRLPEAMRSMRDFAP